MGSWQLVRISDRLPFYMQIKGAFMIILFGIGAGAIVFCVASVVAIKKAEKHMKDMCE